MAKVWAALTAIKELLKLIGEVIGLVKKIQHDKDKSKNEKLEQAVDDAVAAQTDQEALDAQQSIVDNKS